MVDKVKDINGCLVDSFVHTLEMRVLRDLTVIMEKYQINSDNNELPLDDMVWAYKIFSEALAGYSKIMESNLTILTCKMEKEERRLKEGGEKNE